MNRISLRWLGLLIVIRLCDASISLNSALCMSLGLFCDFEGDCAWKWTQKEIGQAGFQIVSQHNVTHWAKTYPPHTFIGPQSRKEDFDEKFLFLSLRPKENYKNDRVEIFSPFYERSTEEDCYLEFSMIMKNFNDVQHPLKVLVVHSNFTTYSGTYTKHNDTEKGGNWKKYHIPLGRKDKRFKIAIEVEIGHSRPAFVAVDNLKFFDCFTDLPPTNGECCGVKCDSGNKCITPDHVCDLVKNCKDGEDEAVCSKVPEGARCNFEGGNTCGWKNLNKKNLDKMHWRLHQGPTEKERTGPDADHTYGNESGTYMLSELPTLGNLADYGILESPVFPAPPCVHSNSSSPWYQSCKVRFYYHKQGKTHASIGVDVVPESKQKKSELIFQSVAEKGATWNRLTQVIPADVIMPYKIRITHTRGTTYVGDLGLDDITLSPECFGIGLPKELMAPCPVVPDPTLKEPTTTSTSKPPGVLFWVLNTCGATGHKGPNVSQCIEKYKKQQAPVPKITSSSQLQGYQSWTVSADGYYTLIAKGASGGSGVQTKKEKTSGASTRGVFFFERNTTIHFLIGQEGLSACNDGKEEKKGEIRKMCDEGHNPPESFEDTSNTGINRLKEFGNNKKSKILPGGGGGGGGGTFIFIIQNDKPVPLLVAGGGGGLAWQDDIPLMTINYGRGVNESFEPLSGNTSYDGEGAGPGGGMQGEGESKTSGISLTKGGEGGPPCYNYWKTYGGFGGGGGGCIAGGGGGGFTGGNAGSDSKRHGEGGMSFISGNFAQVTPASHIGPGVVYIIKATNGQCKCDYLCAYLDEDFNQTTCICGQNYKLADDKVSCISNQASIALVLIVTVVVLLIIFIGFICAYVYLQINTNKKTPSDLLLAGHSRAMHNGVSMTTNPTYEVQYCSAKDLKPIDRRHLTLIKPLGQGAFGEVFFGYLKNASSDSVDLPCAVKTLQDLSSKESEMDFLMEALIMHKFDHPNIVHFMGVCFERMPRFIVLELLSGGDLKNFLRDVRPCPDKPSPIVMKDLICCAIDVAKGCEYLEANHFIHRDIAARNCLLTTKGPGRVVKIADFGMARDIYRNDYYRKGGKAMLPVKWMPTEAFMDGVFTSKTDIWSFGVLLWEVMSLGYMPYPGRGNQEVMTMVTNGGRLEPPKNCPPPLYRIMTQCWHPSPEDRPTFKTIRDTLDLCSKDPNILNYELPLFPHPAAVEKDETVMRPNSTDASINNSISNFLRHIPYDAQSPNSQEYLIPMPSSYSLSTVRSDFRSNPSLEDVIESYSMDRLMEEPTLPPPPTWETSFTDEPPAVTAPRPPVSVEPAESPPQGDDISGASPLLISPPSSPIPHSRESREMLLKPGEVDKSSSTKPYGSSRSREHLRNGKQYHPHKYNNSGSSNNSSSSTASSSTASSSTGSNSLTSNSSSTASTLPLDPANLPSCIPPPLPYVNVDVNNRTADFSQEQYPIVERREHREISC